MKRHTMIQACKAASALMLLIGTAAVGLSATSDNSNSSSPTPAATMAAMKTNSKVRILLEKNIFQMVQTRDRQSGFRPRTPSDTQPASDPANVGPKADKNYVLKGIGMEDGVCTAFFEQTAENQTIRSRAGESLAHGKVGAMTLDGVDYARNDKTLRIAIGQNLEGKVAPTTVSRPSGWTSAGGAAASDKPSWWGRKSDDTAQPAAAAPPADPGGYGNRRQNRGGRDQSDQRGSRDSRGRSDQTDSRGQSDQTDIRDSRGQSDQTDTRDSRGQSDQTDSRDSRDTRDSRDSGNSRDAASPDSRDSRDAPDRRDDSSPTRAIVVPDDLPPIPIIIDGN